MRKPIPLQKKKSIMNKNDFDTEEFIDELKYFD